MPSELPLTRYTRNGDVHLAYQVVGDGPIDLVVLGDWWIPLDGRWDEPALVGPLTRLASFSRLILFDKRGVGCSDPVPPEEALATEEWMNDLRVLMDTVGSERAALLAASDAGAAAVLFAATYPHRTASLILVNSTAYFLQAPDNPWGMPASAFERLLEDIAIDWTFGTTLDKAVPVIAGHPRLRRWLLTGRRTQASPRTARAIYQTFLRSDVRHVLPAIQAPTLVLHRKDCYTVRADHGRYLAEHIPGATYRELPGEDLLWWAEDPDRVVDEIEEFLTGVRPPTDPDRVLATVLFTDIVGSTEQAATLGDRRWRELLDRHDDVIRRELDRFRGREVKVVGDEFVATFDGPARAIRCACAIKDAVQPLGIEIRAGLHTGEIELRGDDIAGMAVHIGARVASLAGPGEVLVSGAIPPLVVGSGLRFSDRGARELKGVEGEWRIFAVSQ